MQDHSIKRKATTVRLPDYMLADLNVEARRQGISLSRLLENITEERLYQQPNVETLAAIEEARSGVKMEKVDLSSFENYIKSMEE